MTRKYITALCLSASLLTGSCTKLDEDLYSLISQDQFGSTAEEINSLIGPAYGTLVNYVNNDFWMGEITSDEYMIPARGLDWYSGGIHLRYHTHEWSARETPNFWRFEQVATVNKILDLLDNTTIEIENKDRIYAELRTLRAFWYFIMLDNIGNVPIVTKFEGELPTNNSRKEVYDFVESELLAVADDLSEEKSMATYTKATKWVAYTLLAKLYLNAQVYTGTAAWDKCLDYCNRVIGSNQYQLEPNIFNNFKVKNESSVENIWAIPYDADFFRGYFIPYQMSWHYSQYVAFDVQFSSWNGPCAVPSFVKGFDPDDARIGSFLIGLQTKPDGTPIYIRDGITQLNYTVDMVNYANATENEGARLYKWEVEKGGRTHMNNDFAIFRYSDVLLMKAEALLRTSAANEPEARTLVNEVRDRNFSPAKPLANLTLDLLLKERGYEFVFEGWRRNDLIRFDAFKGTWSFKPNEDPADRHTYLFPIPLTVMDKNPHLDQNDGY
ncbi:MAG: RagB/SusD family nutrient uptake outer membrane protein [Candidatus Pseudobacter hemicellulosilyticus]|uniref:RagB/SusD family nutrient uptake outer membrane protein n=1 Tax=Candidatus Pseudobacter hemicellulosilyticus TaxID=3121375 RepID=A0AAJ6BFR0_9BACT|nr:MAG: RagB/SusD family nutrient uptake outer membrane protein [Pseudobacter sp.]